MKARLRDLTTEQIELLSNGCGAKSGFIPVPEFIFHASCDKHDVLYLIGGTEEDKKKADVTFYRYMLLDVQNENSILKRIQYKAWAYVYYKMVCKYGKKCFKYGEQKTLEDLELMCSNLRSLQK